MDILNEKQILNKIARLPVINGYKRRKSYGEPIISLEARAIDPISTSMRGRKVTNEQQKVFAHSKVLNALYLATKVKLNFKAEPWLNCVAYKNLVIAYVWDSREIHAVDDNAKAADVIRKTEWEDCAYDVYNAFDERPMIRNSAKHSGINDFIKLANTWVQPFIRIAHYQTKRNDKVQRHEEYEIVTYAPNEGEVYIGEVVIQEVSAGKFRSAIYMDNLLKDVWPNISGKSSKFTKQRLSKLVTADEVHYALLDALTA